MNHFNKELQRALELRAEKLAQAVPGINFIAPIEEHQDEIRNDGDYFESLFDHVLDLTCLIEDALTLKFYFNTLITMSNNSELMEVLL